MNPSVSVVSPIYNDIRTMPTVLPRLERLLSRAFTRWEIVLIDDNSTDGSRDWIKQYSRSKKRVHVWYHKTNEGIARIYRELYRRGSNEILVLFSLDGEWDPADAVRLAETLSKKSCDIVVGARKFKSYTLWRTIVSFFYNTLTKVLYGVTTRDAGSIKAMRKEVVDAIPIKSRGVFDEAERLIRAKQKGYTIGFIPVVHKKTHRKLRGIRVSHVTEACMDSLRVYADLHRLSP